METAEVLALTRSEPQTKAQVAAALKEHLAKLESAKVDLTEAEARLAAVEQQTQSTTEKLSDAQRVIGELEGRRAELALAGGDTKPLHPEIFEAREEVSTLKAAGERLSSLHEFAVRDVEKCGRRVIQAQGALEISMLSKQFLEIGKRISELLPALREASAGRARIRDANQALVGTFGAAVFRWQDGREAVFPVSNRTSALEDDSQEIVTLILKTCLPGNWQIEWTTGHMERDATMY